MDPQKPETVKSISVQNQVVLVLLYILLNCQSAGEEMKMITLFLVGDLIWKGVVLILLPVLLTDMWFSALIITMLAGFLEADSWMMMGAETEIEYLTAIDSLGIS